MLVPRPSGLDESSVLDPLKTQATIDSRSEVNVFKQVIETRSSNKAECFCRKQKRSKKR